MDKRVMKFWNGFKKQRNRDDTKNPKEPVVPELQTESTTGPDPAMRIILEGFELSKQGKYDESELRFYEVTAIDPNYTAVWYATSFSNYPNGLDELLFNALGADNQVEAYDKVLSIHSNNTRALMWKGFCLDKLGKYDEGLECYKRAIEINPRALWLLTNKIRVDLMFNRHEEAIFTLEAILRINPKEHIALGIMAGVLNALGRDEEALIFYDKALAVDPRNAILLCGKGTSLDNVRRFPEAYDCFEKALEIEPNNFCVLTNMGVVLQEMGMGIEALASYDKALMISPTFANALYNKARLKANQNRYNDVLDLLEKAIGSDANCKERARNAPEFYDMKQDTNFIKLIN